MHTRPLVDSRPAAQAAIRKAGAARQVDRKPAHSPTTKTVSAAAQPQKEAVGAAKAASKSRANAKAAAPASEGGSAVGAELPGAKRPGSVGAVAAVKASQSKPNKHKLVRDSFSMPKAEYQVIDQLKQRSAKLARPAKKSELLRAGLKALVAMDDVTFTAAIHAVPAIKTGRPRSKKSADHKPSE